MNYARILHLALPETIVVLTAFLALFIDMVSMKDQSRKIRQGVIAAFAGFGCLVAIGLMGALPEYGRLLDGMFVADGWTQFAKMILLGLVLFTMLISLQSDFTDHVGEYFALLLFATAGLMFFISSENLLMLFVSLEMASLSLYILTAFNKRSSASAEAALKYFLFGGMAAAFLLFGLSLLYGLTGEINLPALAIKLLGRTGDPLLYVALSMVIIGFGFKIAAVPFHFWTPDAYQGAPTPSAAFIASGSKLASFFVLAKFMAVGFASVAGSGALPHAVPGWMLLLALLAFASMALGNFAAIAQSSVKRLLAYSAIAHAGYLLIAVIACGQPEERSHNLATLLYYLTTYGLATIGAFGVVSLVENDLGAEKLSSFAGFARRAPLPAFCLLIFLLSLAGIPPLAGFFGKFAIFAAALRTEPGLGLLWLIIAAIAFSAVSLYYYLQVLKQVYVAPAAEDAQPLSVHPATLIALVLLAALTIFLGCFPQTFFDLL